ncbi:pseudouridine synthase [Chitinophaga sedimenti]|uniref:pseudouridine synthase n=1 Tax=Chitinophaga sedimenti TaxID=2033606 RepID=UPI002006A173|nr:pseudouridine synthase [Chitinophaga sedimenti]MCK7555488.1 pseudouridine synthase [Chitinophaga sedimenti]
MDKSINKYIAETGFCSRREADKYIEQGRVTINDNIASKGNRVEDGDVVEVDGEPLKKKSAPVYIALNKPKGITCTTDLKDKTNIIDFVNYKTRVFPIGRLDKLSEGLIFLTNDGDIVNKVLRAGNKHEKEYIVTVDKPITVEFLKNMRGGVRILNTGPNPVSYNRKGQKDFVLSLPRDLTARYAACVRRWIIR